MDAIVIVSARDEADRLPATLAALGEAFPRARLIVADDASRDATAAVARRAGVEVVSQPRHVGKGGATTAAARLALPLTTAPDPPVVVLCDGDLGASARELARLAEAVRSGGADLAVGVFARAVGGGFGVAVGFARRALRRLTGLELQAPISGQRAMRGEVLATVTPFAAGFGMEIGMTTDAHRAGFRIVEVRLDLEHRATGRTAAGFLHRARQLRDFVVVTLDRMAG
jgi:glycosyltransferase involved in cell wall biosynthesis